jgi:hypothetical protein
LYVSGLSPSPATILARQIFVDEIEGSFTEVLRRGLHKKEMLYFLTRTGLPPMQSIRLLGDGGGLLPGSCEEAVNQTIK